MNEYYVFTLKRYLTSPFSKSNLPEPRAPANVAAQTNQGSVMHFNKKFVEKSAQGTIGKPRQTAQEESSDDEEGLRYVQ